MANDSANAASDNPPAQKAGLADPKTSRLGQWWDWLFPRQASSLGAEPATLDPERRAMLRSARDYVGVADGLLDTSDDVPTAPVLALYREAIFLLLANTWAEKKTLAVRFETAPESTLAEVQAAEPVVTGLRHILAMHALATPGERTTAEQRDLAHVTASAVHRLLDEIAPSRPNRSLYRRFSRIVGVALVIALLLTGLVFATHRLLKPTDLAAGKPWHTSSQLAALYSARILFHTNEEMNPWFEIDLGASKTVKALQVVNRGDANQDRAIPLVAEVSSDKSQWREVARRDEPFSIWEPRFPATQARFVRLRVPRLTMFHLQAVKVF